MNDQTRKETKDTEEAEMTKENTSERTGHHERDEAELARLENNSHRDPESRGEVENPQPRNMFAWILTAVIVAVVLI